MPSVSYNGQSLAVDGRKIWITGAALAYARIPEDQWADRIADVHDAGFNTVSIACPWCIHEPRKGRFLFDGPTDVGRFVRLCQERDLRVIVRTGPFVGDGYDAGGIPPWLVHDPAILLRERAEGFIDRVGRYFRKLWAELGDLQATKGGPIVLVQIEQAWACANDEGAVAYLGELARLIRECAIGVPLVNGNNLWADPAGTVDTWQGRDDLLANLRQLRLVQPDAPRIVSCFEVAPMVVWGGDGGEGPLAPDVALRRLAQILAAGAQPVVDPFHAGSFPGFLGGRLPASTGVCSAAAMGAPVGEAGARGPMWRALRRLALFANSFEYLFADLDPEYQPVTLDQEYIGRGGRGSASISLVPLRGGGGKVVFAFSDRIGGATRLLMQNGIRLDVDLGDQPVGWYVADLDLHGRGKLDYANVCPVAMVARKLVVFQGPAKHVARMSIGGSPIEVTVPTGNAPTVVEHKGLHLIICNQKQIDAVVLGDDAVFVGASRLDADGAPISAKGWGRVHRIDADGTTRTVKSAGSAPTSPAAMKLSDWTLGSCEDYAAGTSPRFASLAGPQDLPSCGATTGYGWYSIALKAGSTKTRTLLSPECGGRISLYLDGELQTIYGDGPGATGGPISLRLPKGEHKLVALVENDGQYASGHDLDRPIGFRDQLYDIKALAAKGKIVERMPVDPFTLRQFVFGATAGVGSDAQQLEYSFSHLKKSPILVHFENVSVPGTLVLNDVPIALHAGETGSCRRTIALDPAHEAFRRGKNVVHFAPDAGRGGELKRAAKGIGLYTCADSPTSGAAWSFAKWEPPAAGRFKPISATAAAAHPKQPAWWLTTVDPEAIGDAVDAIWFDTNGLSKGHLLVNGRHVGRYFTRTAEGAAVGPQRRLLIPGGWLNREAGDKANEILVFDEHGFAPHKTRLTFESAGDLDG